MVMAVARQLRLNPLPFAMTTVWLANTASPLLPVSNLTNLRALYRFSALGLDHSGYISLALSPALAAIVATVAVLAVIHLRVLRGHSRGSPNTPRRDVADCGRLRVPGARPRLCQCHHLGHPGISCGPGAGRHRPGAQPSSFAPRQGALTHRSRGQRVVRCRGHRPETRPARPARQLGWHPVRGQQTCYASVQLGAAPPTWWTICRPI